MAKFKININETFCKGCGICVHFCPQHALKMADKTSDRMWTIPVQNEGHDCAGCKRCELMCPHFAIAISRGDEE